MGKIKQGILGGFSGKVGTVVGSSWKGIAVMRGIALHVANPKSDKQLVVREDMIVLQKFLCSMTSFIRIGWKNFAIKMSQMNAAFSYNHANALQGTYPNIAIDYPNALVSRGQLPGVLNGTAASTVAATIAFTWLDNSDEAGASDTDKTLICIFSPAKNQAVTAIGLATRLSNSQAVTVPSSFSGDLVHCYIAYETEDGTVQSNSSYAGAVTVA